MTVETTPTLTKMDLFTRSRALDSSRISAFVLNILKIRDYVLHTVLGLK